MFAIVEFKESAECGFKNVFHFHTALINETAQQRYRPQLVAYAKTLPEIKLEMPKEGLIVMKRQWYRRVWEK